MSTRLGMARAAGAATMVMRATAEPNTTDAHAVIESHGPVVWCAGQPESAGAAPCPVARTSSGVDAAFDTPAEWLLTDAEPTEPPIDISL